MKFSGTNKSVVYVTKYLYDLQQDSGSIHVHTHDRKPHPVLLRYFVLHGLHHNPSNSTQQHLFAAVSWLKDHHARYYFGKPLEIWWKVEYVDFDTYIPIQLLTCHSVYCDIKHEEQTVYLMCPVHNVSAV